MKISISFLRKGSKMGKKRGFYCPYCDVYLTHNSLRSRRDHNEGWRHIASFHTYYAKFLAQSPENPVMPSSASAQSAPDSKSNEVIPNEQQTPEEMQMTSNSGVAPKPIPPKILPPKLRTSQTRRAPPPIIRKS